MNTTRYPGQTCVLWTKALSHIKRLIPKGTWRLRPFSSKRFHALLNSLFKVLFNFPSRYLFAIGLVVIFSLRRGLPSTLGCTPKQPDSTEAQTDERYFGTGLAPALGSHSRELPKLTTRQIGSPSRHRSLNHGLRDSALDYFPFTRRY
jgi:hypothetical protein